MLSNRNRLEMRREREHLYKINKSRQRYRNYGIYLTK